MSQFRPRLSQQQYKALENLRADERRILVIGDLHRAVLPRRGTESTALRHLRPLQLQSSDIHRGPNAITH
jgi:hypothetical protein